MTSEDTNSIAEKDEDVAGNASTDSSGRSVKAITFQKAISNFKRDVTSVATSYPLTTEAVAAARNSKRLEFANFADKHLKFSSDLEPPSRRKRRKKIEVLIPVEQAALFQSLVRDVSRVSKGYTLVSRSFLFSLVSQYDAYIANLLRAVFSARPEILNSSQKSMTLAEMSTFSSIDEARIFVIEREIDEILRGSHSSQLEFFDKKLKIGVREVLDSWSEFVEITERRNLFAHTDGTISEQYVSVCKRNGYEFPSEPKVGAELEVDTDYFDRAFLCTLEAGLKLGHILWRKFQPATADHKRADRALNDDIIELISEERYQLAIRLLEFAIDKIGKKSEDATRRIFVINLAQSYKWSGQDTKALEIIRGHDWSATAQPFHLALRVLEDDFDSAAKIMSQIGNQGGLSKSEYQQWPLFKEFRRTEQFQRTYKKIFGENYEVESIPKAVAGEMKTERREASRAKKARLSPEKAKLGAEGKAKPKPKAKPKAKQF